MVILDKLPKGFQKTELFLKIVYVGFGFCYFLLEITEFN